jgi:hypothetical protein
MSQLVPISEELDMQDDVFKALMGLVFFGGLGWLLAGFFSEEAFGTATPGFILFPIAVVFLGVMAVGNAAAKRLLRVTEGGDDGVIEVDEDRAMKMAPLGVVSGAVVGAVTALSTG